MTINLLPQERIDDLQKNGYQIIQNPQKFCFGMDAVLLSGFARVKKNEEVLDLGTGTGIIPILLEAKTEGRHFIGLEIQEESADMARRSVQLNHLEDKIEIVTGDIRNASELFNKHVFDVVTVNPPYMIDKHGIDNPDLPKAIARHEILCTLEEVIREAALVVKPGGRFYMVQRPFRLAEIITLMVRYKLEPKRLRFVHPYMDSEPNIILVEGLQDGRSGMRVEKPLIVFTKPGVYSEEMTEKYSY